MEAEKLCGLTDAQPAIPATSGRTGLAILTGVPVVRRKRRWIRNMCRVQSEPALSKYSHLGKDIDITDQHSFMVGLRWMRGQPVASVRIPLKANAVPEGR